MKGIEGVNGLSAFLAAWIVVVAVVGWVVARRELSESRRFIIAFVGLVVATWTRDLLWIYLGLEAVSVVTLRLGARTMVGSLVSLSGLVLVVASSGTTDLAALEPTLAVGIGIVLFLCGLISCWLQLSTVEPFVFLGAGVVIVAVFMRLTAWSPGLAEALAPLTWWVAIAGVAGGSLGAAFSETTRSLVAWLAIATVALAVAALAGGAPVLPHVLLHVAASAVALALALALESSGGSPLASWLTLLSLASFPPLPGFATKLGVLASLSPVTLAIAVAGMFLIGVGCARALDRSQSRPGRLWVSAAAVAMTIAFGLFPGPLLGVATRAAAALF